ncbi:MAG: hypothetical protein IAF38_03980, partial [Bacteroidia bacterium]|nr:hypothetical protein [Bacteroidia bacterium]
KIVQKIFPGEVVEWFSLNITDTLLSDEEDCGETLYLINAQLPDGVTKNAADFIPKNRFDFLKANYIKATLKMTYSYVHPRAGDSFDSWFVEFLQANTVKFTLMNNDTGIYVIDNSDDLDLKESLPVFIKSCV